MNDAVLDASVPLAVSHNEPSHDMVARVLYDAAMSAVNVPKAGNKTGERGEERGC